MQSISLEFQSTFHVVAGNNQSQSAVLVLAPGDSTGGPDNRHERGDQWLYVVAGKGEAIVEGERRALRPGLLLLIERGETPEIRNLGDELLKTLNFYVPPEYGAEAGKPPERD